MKGKTVIAADLGASGGKMAKGSYDGSRLLAGDFFDFENKPVELNKNLYWNLFALYNSILQGTAQYSQDCKVDSISVDTWGATYGLLDSKGRLLEPIYHYRDLRTEHSMERMYQRVSRENVFQLTGCQPARSYTLPQLYSYVEHREKILDLADTMLFLPDLLTYFLSGEKVTERSIAGTSGLLRPDQKDWCYDLFRMLGIQTDMLLPLTDPGTERGMLSSSIADSLNIKPMKVISVIGHDTASAVAGIPYFGIGQVYISIGTNINMGVEVTESITGETAFRGGYKNAAVMEDRKILYRDFAAFWMLNEFQRSCREEGRSYSYQEMMDLASVSESKGVFVDADDEILNNAGGNIKEKINTFLERSGQKTLSEDADFIRCILESIALKVKYCTEYLEKELHIPLHKISVINGGTRNYVLMQMISDALARPVYCGLPYATLTGNILTQLYALGELKSVNEMRDLSGRSFSMKEYYPEKNRREYWDSGLQKMIEKGICK
ncbi:rhamnulokinase [Blautia sp.]|uniref:rhamnulokinase n=1 Tax=Blautia sp. TaxID=1955243 RepID=UPI003D8FAB8F